MIFIVGVGRSGTSLLQSMLNAHPEIVSTPETHFLRSYVFPNLKNNGLLDANILFAELAEDNDFKRISISKNEILKDEYNEKVDLLAFYKRMFAIYAGKKGKQYVVDKDPRNIDYIPQLKQLFPDSKIIHIYRDPRDVVVSKTKAAWSSSLPYWLHAFIGQYQISRGRKNGQKYFGENGKYIEIRYESLLQYPKKTLEELTTFLGVNYNDSMLSFSQSAKELVDEKEMQWKKETLKPLMKSNSNKWKTNLTTFQAALIEECSPEYFKKLNYSKETIKIISFPKKILLYILPVLNLIMPIIYKVATSRK